MKGAVLIAAIAVSSFWAGGVFGDTPQTNAATDAAADESGLARREASDDYPFEGRVDLINTLVSIGLNPSARARFYAESGCGARPYRLAKGSLKGILTLLQYLCDGTCLALSEESSGAQKKPVDSAICKSVFDGMMPLNDLHGL